MENKSNEKRKKMLIALSIALTTGAASIATISQIANNNNNSKFECEIEGEHEHELNRTTKVVCDNEEYKDKTLVNYCWASDETVEMLLDHGYKLTGNIKYNEPVKTLVRK